MTKKIAMSTVTGAVIINAAFAKGVPLPQIVNAAKVMFTKKKLKLDTMFTICNETSMCLSTVMSQAEIVMCILSQQGFKITFETEECELRRSIHEQLDLTQNGLYNQYHEKGLNNCKYSSIFTQVPTLLNLVAPELFNA